MLVIRVWSLATIYIYKIANLSYLTDTLLKVCWLFLVKFLANKLIVLYQFNHIKIQHKLYYLLKKILELTTLASLILKHNIHVFFLQFLKHKVNLILIYKIQKICQIIYLINVYISQIIKHDLINKV